MNNGRTIIGTITCGDIAETIRLLPETENPSDDALTGFQAYMNPPEVEPFAKG